MEWIFKSKNLNEDMCTAKQLISYNGVVEVFRLYPDESMAIFNTFYL